MELEGMSLFVTSHRVGECFVANAVSLTSGDLLGKATDADRNQAEQRALAMALALAGPTQRTLFERMVGG